MEDCVIDVAIVGAGLSGLLVARRQTQLGKRVVVLEAGAGVGGRIQRLATDRSGVDLGPAWCWPHQHRVLGLLRELDVPVFEQFSCGRSMFERPGEAPQSIQTPAMPASYRVQGGWRTLVDRLVEAITEVDIRLNTAVTGLRQVDVGWRIEVRDGESLAARKVVLACPPRVIAAHVAIESQAFAVDALMRDLAAVPTWMAGQAKFVAIFETPFWRERGLSGNAFSYVGPMMEIHDATDGEATEGALFGFIGVPAPQRAGIDEDLLERACLDQFVRLFGPDAAEPVAWRLMDWSNNAFVATEADRNGPSVHPHFDLPRWAEQLADTGLFLAGTEVAQEEAGYLEGAVIAADLSLDG